MDDYETQIQPEIFSEDEPNEEDYASEDLESENEEGNYYISESDTESESEIGEEIKQALRNNPELINSLNIMEPSSSSDSDSDSDSENIDQDFKDMQEASTSEESGMESEIENLDSDPDSEPDSESEDEGKEVSILEKTEVTKEEIQKPLYDLDEDIDEDEDNYAAPHKYIFYGGKRIRVPLPMRRYEIREHKSRNYQEELNYEQYLDSFTESSGSADAVKRKLGKMIENSESLVVPRDKLGKIVEAIFNKYFYGLVFTGELEETVADIMLVLNLT